MENKMISVEMEMEKATKNTIKFVEKPESEFVPEKIGSLYVPKVTLAGIKYAGGKIIVDLSANIGIAKMMPEKATKNTIKFAEVMESEFVPEKIGTVYVPKSTLAEMGYAGGELYVGIRRGRIMDM